MVYQDLLKAGANVDVQNNEGRTPLHFAARDGYVDVVKVTAKKLLRFKLFRRMV